MSKPRYSIVVPVFNRPQEVEELLDSLTQQAFTNFEVIVVEDGSTEPCHVVVADYNSRLRIEYYLKENTGPGLTRNYGAQRTNGEYLIFFDSDCIIPSYYLTIVDKELTNSPVDAFGGPDRAHESFTPVQKAINYSMTSFFTTGGIRGGNHKMDKFYPRSFNMGFRKDRFMELGGFAHIRFGEDIDLSTRAFKAGYNVRLFQDAFVYHKRRTDFRKFYRQVYCSGLARITLHLIHPGSLKLVHTLPSLFVSSMMLSLVLSPIFPYLILIPIFYSFLVLVDSLRINQNLGVAMLSIVAAWVQLFGYGLGFYSSVWKRIILRKKEHTVFEDNFYG